MFAYVRYTSVFAAAYRSNYDRFLDTDGAIPTVCEYLRTRVDFEVLARRGPRYRGRNLFMKRKKLVTNQYIIDLLADMAGPETEVMEEMASRGRRELDGLLTNQSVADILADIAGRDTDGLEELIARGRPELDELGYLVSRETKTRQNAPERETWSYPQGLHGNSYEEETDE